MKTNLSLKDELLSAIRRIVAKFWAQEVGQLMRLQSVGYHAKLRTKIGIRSRIGSRMLLSTLLMLTVCIGNAWGALNTVYTLTPTAGSDNSYAGDEDIDCEDTDNDVTITWNVTGNATMVPWRLGGKSSKGNTSTFNRAIYSKDAIGDNISQIVITHGGASSITVNSMTITVSTNSDFSSPVSTLTPTFAANTTVTIDRPNGKDWSNCYYKINYYVSITGASNRFVEFSGAVFKAESGTSVSLTNGGCDGSGGTTKGSFTMTQSSSPITSVTTTSAAQTVDITCTPANGYYTSSVSATDPATHPGSITYGGSGNNRTVTYPTGHNGSSTITVTFACVTPTFGTNLNTSTVNYAQGAAATALTVAASANSATINYQWQTSPDNSVWTNTGTNSSANTSLTPSTSSVGTTYYRCIATNAASGCSATATSNVATVTVTAGSTWKFKYSGDSWATTHTMTESAGVASFSISLAADSRFEFGFDDNGSAFYKNNGTIITTTSGWTFNTSDGNCKIHTGPAGTYTFAINTTSKAVTVTYPTVDHPNDHYVYFKNTNVWGTVYGYLGNSGNDNKAAAWPGSVMQATTTICGETYHYAALNAMSGTYNVINFNNGGSGYGNQTSDLSTSGLGKFNANQDANWHDFKYAITFAGNGNTGGSMSDVSNICLGSNHTLASSGFTKTGYTFGGWKANVDVKIGGATVTAGTVIANAATIQDIQSNITLTAQWTANTINITLDKNNNDASGSSSGSASVKYDNTALESGTTHASRTGYTLEGYYADQECTHKVMTAAGALVNYTGYVESGQWKRATTPTTLYANWTIKNFTVSWKWKGNTDYTAGVSASNNNANYCTTVNAPTAPADNSLDCANKFMGWSATPLGSETGQSAPGDLFTTTSPAITENTTFYAVFATSSGGGSAYYAKVTAKSQIDPAGRYLIVYENSETQAFIFDGSLTTLDATPDTIMAPISSGKITANAHNEASEFSIDTANLYIKSASKKYINHNGWSNGLASNDDATAVHSISIDGSKNFVVEGTGKSGSTYVLLKYNSAAAGGSTYGSRFRFYKSGQHEIQLYKYNPGASYSNYVTSCCSLKPVTSLAVSSVTANSVTLSWTAPSPTTSIDHLELRNASTDAKIGSNIAVGTTTATVSGLTECTTYTYKVVSVGASCETPSETVDAQPYSGAKTITYKYHDDVTADGSFSTDCTHSSTTLPNPSRTGYTLNGWYTDATGGTKKGDGGASYTPDATITLHAQWSQTNYTVTMAQSPSAGATLTGGTTTAHYGNTINISTDVPSGYRFSGWTSSPSVTFANASATSTSFSMPASSVTVTANFVQIHTLTFTIPSGGGSAVTPPATADHGGTVTLPSTTGKSSEYSCETFLGWTTTAPNGSGTWATTPSYKAAGATSDAINANTTFYAVYSRSGGGASGSVSLPCSVIATWKSDTLSGTSNAYGTSTSVRIDNHTWTTTGNIDDAGEIKIKDGYYLQIPTLPGNISSITMVVSQSNESNACAEYPGSATTKAFYFRSAANGSNLFSSETTSSRSRTITITSGEYTTGYICCTDGTGNIHSVTVNYGPAPIVSHTLECGCAIAQFDLTYNANTTYFPGSTTSCSGEDDYVFASHDDEYTICSTEPTLDGYKFTGWTTNANGSGDHFDAGEVVSCMPSADVTLYAQYERVYTVTFNNQGSTTPVTQGSYGAAIDVPNATTPCNDPADPDTYTWAFVGWSKTAIAPMSFLPTLEIEAGTETYTPEEDLTLYAIYRKTTTSDAFVAGASGAYKIKATSSGTDYYAAGYSSTKINATTTSGDAVTYYIRYNSVGSNYTIQQADGKYIAYKGNTPSGSNPDLKLSDDAFYWSISSAGGGLWAIQSPTSTDANTRYLQLSVGTGFKAYTDNVNPTFVAAEASFYYRTMSCASDFDITFQTGDWTINWAVGHPEASYKHLADATEVSTFPTASYNGWTFLGWRVSEYAGSISAPDGASIYGGSNGTSGNTYTIASTDVVMYPVFTQFLDNAPFDTIYGGNYYIYYIADGDISTSQDVYGANNRIYAGSYSSHAYTSTPNCGSATSFTFTKLPNGKWTIYDNNNNKYLLGESSGNDLYLDKTATAANYGEWTITVHSGNQFEARCQSGYALSALTSNATSGTFKDYSSGNFSSNAGLYHRIYLGTCTERMFTTDPVRNATITINGDVKVTSTASKAIKSTSVLSVTANNIDETTLSVSSNNSHFTVNPSSITVTNHQVAATSVTITYTPAADATTDGTEDATITVSDGAGTSEEVTVTGRHLPADFVIAAKIGDNWYALPADCSTSSSSTAGILIDVDNASDPTCATGAPENTKYGLLPVRPGRVSDYGSRLVFTEHLSTATTEDQKTLYNGSTTSIQVDAMYKYYANTNPEKYEWIPATSDLKDYTLTSATILGGDAAARTVSLNTSGVFGTLLQAKAYDGKVRLLPATFYEPAEVQILKWKTNSVIVMYTGSESATTKVGSNDASSAQGLESHKLSHGIYEFTTNQSLTDNTGQTLLITLGSSRLEVEIPRIIAANTTAAADGKDLVILDGYKFTAAATKYNYRNVYVYGGGKLDIPSGTSLGVNNIILRAGGITTSGIGSSPAATYEYKYPQVKLVGTLTSTQTNIKYEYVTDYTHWYHLCLPFNALTSTIQYPQEYYGDIVTADNHGSWIIKRYDGETRATGNYEAWVDIESAGEPTPTTVTAGHGYIFWGAPKKVSVGGATAIRQAWGIQRMTMATTATAATTAETADKNISVDSYSNLENPSNQSNDQGWNLVGNPYMVNLTGLSSESLIAGQLVHSNTNPWDGTWINAGQETRYVTIPDENFNTYTAQPMAWFTEDNPMINGRVFFVQIAEGASTLTFEAENRAALAPAWHRNAEAEQTVDVETGIVMSSETLADEVNFWIKEGKTEAYEFNADYPKTPNKTNFNIYGVHQSGNLSWVAISPAIAEGDMAIGYQVPAAGDYTLSLSEKYIAEDIESVFVTDHGVSPELTTDLMVNTYSFTVHQAETNNERFTVSIKVREEDNTATDIGNNTVDTHAVKFIRDDKMYILRNGLLYDATGKRVTEINK